MLAKCGRHFLFSARNLARCQQQVTRSISFELTDAQREFQEVSRKFAREVIVPQAKDWDQQNKYPADVHKQAWELGFYSIGIPEKYGGLGQGE